MHHHQPVTTVVMYYLAEVLWGQLIKIFFPYWNHWFETQNFFWFQLGKSQTSIFFQSFFCLLRLNLSMKLAASVTYHKYYKNAYALEYKKSTQFSFLTFMYRNIIFYYLYVHA